MFPRLLHFLGNLFLLNIFYYKMGNTVMNSLKNKYTAIACVNNKNVLGNNGSLMYHIKEDMSNFKKMTTDNVVIMGRKTFESLPNKSPLKNRVNIILTTKTDVNFGEYDNLIVCHSVNEVDNICYEKFSDKNLYIIGGGETYKLFYEMNSIRRAIITRVNDDADGDTILVDFSSDDNYVMLLKTENSTAGDLTYHYEIYINDKP